MDGREAIGKYKTKISAHKKWNKSCLVMICPTKLTKLFFNYFMLLCYCFLTAVMLIDIFI